MLVFRHISKKAKRAKRKKVDVHLTRSTMITRRNDQKWRIYSKRTGRASNNLWSNEDTFRLGSKYTNVEWFEQRAWASVKGAKLMSCAWKNYLGSNMT